MRKSGRLALIPARGGSRRLPRKNIIDFAGRPMLAWTIAAARESDLFDVILVSTEDAEIATIAESNGACVHQRPAELADDLTSVAEVARYVLTTDFLDTETFCLLMPNCPLRTGEDIVGAFDRITDFDADAVMSVVRYGWLRPEWAMYEASGWLEFLPEVSAIGERSKEADLVCPSGAIRWSRTQSFLENPTFYPRRLSGFELPWYRAIDIDVMDDFQMASCVAHALGAGFEFHPPSWQP